MHNDMIRGSADDRSAYAWASREQGFAGSWSEWTGMPLDLRQEFEDGAAGGGEARRVTEGLADCGSRSSRASGEEPTP